MFLQFKTLILGMVLCFTGISAHAEGVDVEIRKANAIELVSKFIRVDNLELIPSSVKLHKSYNPIHWAGRAVSYLFLYSTDFEVVSFQAKDALGAVYGGWIYLATSIGCTDTCKDLAQTHDLLIKKSTLPDGRTVYSQVFSIGFDGVASHHLKLIE